MTVANCWLILALVQHPHNLSPFALFSPFLLAPRVWQCLSKGSIKMIPCTSMSFQGSNKIAPPVCPCLYKGLISQCLSKDPIKCSPVCQCLSKGLFSAAPWQPSSISIMSPLSPAPHNQGALINSAQTKNISSTENFVNFRFYPFKKIYCDLMLWNPSLI